MTINPRTVNPRTVTCVMQVNQTIILGELGHDDVKGGVAVSAGVIDAAMHPAAGAAARDQTQPRQ